MGDGQKRFVACFSSSSSSSVKLLFFMIPLVVFSGFVWFLGPNTSYSGFKSAFSFSSSSSINGSAEYTKEKEEELFDLSSRVVVLDVDRDEETLAHQAAALNFSHHLPPPPPLIAKANEDQQLSVTNGSNGEELNETQNGSTLTTESVADRIEPIREKVMRTNLGKLEAGLHRARAAIKNSSHENQIQDPDYVPIGPIYLDAKAFHRSYLEMEKQFRIFVYKEGEPPLFHDGPCKSIYSMEGNFIHQIESDRNRFRTDDPDKAHAFYLAFSVVKMVRFVYERDSRDFGPIRSTVVDYIDLVARRYPYWNRSLGADHFMLSCHDWGPEASFSVPYLQKNSIRALCNANTSEKFNPTKDVSIPEINLLTGKLSGLIGGPSPSRRPILAFFAGGVHGPIRPILLDHWENKDNDIQVHKYLPRGVSYSDMMRKSKFCICPSGYEVASPRIVEALYSGCVPVLISVNYVPPFSDVLNWKAFSVQVAVSEIPDLKKILMGISSRQYIRMQRRVLLVRRHFEFNSPPKRFDVFHMILHSVWLRRLNVRILEHR